MVTNISPQNCWEYWKCEPKYKNKCIAFLSDSGRECWMVTSLTVEDPNQAYEMPTCAKMASKTKITSCFECSWFNKLNK